MMSCLRALAFCLAMTFVLAMAPASAAIAADRSSEIAQARIIKLMSNDAGKWVEVSGTSKAWFISERGQETQFSMIGFTSLFRICDHSRLLVQMQPDVQISLSNNEDYTVKYTRGIAYDGTMWLERLYGEESADGKFKVKNQATPNHGGVNVTEGCAGRTYDWTKIPVSGYDSQANTLQELFSSRKTPGTYSVETLISGDISLGYRDKHTVVEVHGKETSDGAFVPKEVVLRTNQNVKGANPFEERYAYTVDPVTSRFTIPLSITHININNGRPQDRAEVVINSVTQVKDGNPQVYAFYVLPPGWSILNDDDEELLKTSVNYDLRKSGLPTAANSKP